MTVRLRLAAALLTFSLLALARAAEEPPAAPVPSAPAPTTTTQNTKDAIRARIREDAKKQTAAKPAPSAPPVASPTPTPAPTSPISAAPAPSTANATVPTDLAKPVAADPALVLPKIEVNRSKQIHPLAYELFDKEREAAREKVLTKPTELDKALNHPKISLPLFGGQSTSSRASVASERTALLEAEADLIEEIGRAKTKEQKAELRKQLDELKKVRRELEHAIR